MHFSQHIQVVARSSFMRFNRIWLRRQGAIAHKHAQTSIHCMLQKTRERRNEEKSKRVQQRQHRGRARWRGKRSYAKIIAAPTALLCSTSTPLISVVHQTFLLRSVRIVFEKRGKKEKGLATTFYDCLYSSSYAPTWCAHCLSTLNYTAETTAMRTDKNKSHLTPVRFYSDSSSRAAMFLGARKQKKKRRTAVVT